MPALDLNPQFQRALDLMENTDHHLFITGRAGTGKSTLLTHFREHTKKKIAVLAPTGVAALNVRGQTIHSFFLIPPHITPLSAGKEKLSPRLKPICKALETIIIDEVSMVRAELLDCIDVLLRRYRGSQEPFGGVQMIFIGDLYQLPPVVSSNEEAQSFTMLYPSPFFFDAHVLGRTTFELVQLEKIYRQRDTTFIDLLNRVRTNTTTPADLEELNARWIEDHGSLSEHETTIVLTATNAAADAINTARLAEIDEDEHTFGAVVQGNFDQRVYPTAESLTLKKGAQVMMLVNDPAGGYVNGSLGIIKQIGREDEDVPSMITVELTNGEDATVAMHNWEIHRYSFDASISALTTEPVGSFRQFPLRLAWAVTIHKSQGKTFDRVVIDLGRGAFAHGQVYVALSRCTSLDGIALLRPIRNTDIKMDARVHTFFERLTSSVSS
ncbi:MAG: AAA family ATPase [Patescibacteria group bacterium]